MLINNIHHPMQAQELVHKITTTEEIKSHLTQVLEAFQKMDYHRLSVNEDRHYFGK